jgi:hypothetical protein
MGRILTGTFSEADILMSFQCVSVQGMAKRGCRVIVRDQTLLSSAFIQISPNQLGLGSQWCGCALAPHLQG